ncbi:MAG: hypothetical protein P1U88_19675 [Thalassobaculaceae bacterium]|nr:hypothetical protein [Thalassobaculaceae bacterium]
MADTNQLKMIIEALQQNLDSQKTAISELQKEKEALIAAGGVAPETAADLSERLKKLEEDVSAERLRLVIATDRIKQQTLEAEFDYKAFAAGHFKKIAGANLTAIYAILIISCVVVVAGVGFTGLQLYFVVTKGGPQQDSQLEASAQRFRITTSSVGVIVLSLSLFFLYLFASAFYQPLPNDFARNGAQSTPPGAGQTATGGSTGRP